MSFFKNDKAKVVFENIVRNNDGPKAIGLFREDGKYIGFDNTYYKCKTKIFDHYNECIKWLFKEAA